MGAEQDFDATPQFLILPTGCIETIPRDRHFPSP
jgi:hypothetical protein